MPQICRICRNHAGMVTYHPREMMFGTRERFDYFQCPSCGCLQIEEIPPGLGRYYPAGYFSFQDYRALMASRLRRWLEHYRVDRAFRRASRSAAFLGGMFRPPAYMDWMLQAGIGRSDAVLDIGCGSGKLLVRMGLGGFADCTGIDPFISADIVYSDHVRVLKRELVDYAAEMEGRFALVMLHHAFEHMADPHAVLDAVDRLLQPGGCVLIRIPLADSYAWETYRENWVQLDAPRHLHLHTRQSMQYLAKEHGFQIEYVQYDSGPTQILGSELYRHDIPLTASKQRKRSVLTRRMRKAAEHLTQELNQSGRGDQAVFFLRRAFRIP